jgi:hypothetical protein
MWCAALILILTVAIDAMAAIGNATYGIYSNTYEGVKYDSNTVEGGYMGTYNGLVLHDDTTYFTEGGHSLQAVCPAGQTYGGVWMQFGYNGSTNPKVATNMNAYSGGTLDFMVRTTYDIKIGIESGETKPTVLLSSRGSGYLDGNWHAVSIPLSAFAGIDLNNITVPAGFHFLGNDSAPQRSFWIDNVVWRKPGTGTLDVTIKNRVGGQTASQVEWSNAAPFSGWATANQYLELNFTYFHAGWGIQLYTNNRAAQANPAYTGTGDPAGLVDVSSTTQRLPMCWRVVDTSTTTVTIRQGAVGYPYRLWSEQLGDKYPCFIWMMDKNSSDFVNALDYITVWDERGIQQSEDSFAPAVSPNYIYLGADFSQAASSRTYRTNRLMVELYYE